MDTRVQVSLNPTNAQIAARWNCTTRTVLRMKRRGVDVTDPVSVAAYLAGIKSPSRRMLAAAISQLPDK